MALVLASASTVKADEGEKEREPLTSAHAIGAGYNFHWMTSDLTGGMRFHGPSVGYFYDVGRTVRFMIHGKFFFPVVGRMDNGNGSYDGALRSDYPTAWGMDGTLAVGRKFSWDNLDLVVGGGVHMMGVRINSDVYFPVESITMGAGGLVRLRWGLGDREFWQAGIDGQIAADFINLLRQSNPVNLLITTSVVGTVGFKF